MASQWYTDKILYLYVITDAGNVAIKIGKVKVLKYYGLAIEKLVIQSNPHMRTLQKSLVQEVSEVFIFFL